MADRRWLSWPRRKRGAERGARVEALPEVGPTPGGGHLTILVGVSRARGRRVFPLQPDRTSIGRSADCDVHLVDPAISRLHAELVWEDDELWLVHRSGVNRTLLNGVVVPDRALLSDRDEIQLANRVVARLALDAAREDSAREPAVDRTVVRVSAESQPEPPERASPPQPEAAVAEPPAAEAPPEPAPAAAPLEPAPTRIPAPEVEPEPPPRDVLPGPTGSTPPVLPAAPRAPDVDAEIPAPRDSAPSLAPSTPRIAPADVELVIVGAGPAGLAAAVQAASRGLRHALLERGCLANTVERYQKGKWVMDEPPRLQLQEGLSMGFEAGTREQVLSRWREAVEQCGANLLVGPEFELTKIEGSKGAFQLTCKGGRTFSATHVVLAIGVQGNLRRFGVPGDDLPHVTYQLDDPGEHAGKRIVVVGVGDAGIENALALAEHDNDVSLVNRGEEIDRAKPRNRKLIESAIRSGEINYLTSARVDRFEPAAVILNSNNGQMRLDADLVIGRLGAIPPRRFLEEIGVELPSQDRSAVPEVSGTYESNVPGLHIIGALAGYPLIKNCMNQGYEVVEHILGAEVTPADEPVLREKFARLEGSVSEILERIKERIPIFAGLTTIQLREFLFDSEVRHFEVGEVVFQRNEFSNSFFSILEGEVEGWRPKSDDDTDVDVSDAERRSERRFRLGPGEFFGEGSLISGRRRSATVAARTDCVLIESPRIAVNRLIKSVEEVRRVIDQASIVRAMAVLLPGVTDEDGQRLAASARICTFKPGESLFKEGDEPDGLHLIRRGAVTISQEIDGRDTVIQYVQAGNYLGELALLAPNRRRSASVAATVLSETILLPTETIVPYLAEHPELRRSFEQRETEYTIAGAARSADLGRGTVRFLMQETGAHEATDLLLIDESLCIRCNNCEKACSDTHDGVSRLDREAGPTYQTSRGTQLHVPTACQHCENPKCMDDCPPDAIRRHPDGEVYILDSCIGCGNCVANCPYDVIQMASIDRYAPRGLLASMIFGERRGAQPPPVEGTAHSEQAVKCDLCRNLPPRRRGEPRAACVAACPTGAIVRVNPRNLVDEIQRS